MRVGNQRTIDGQEFYEIVDAKGLLRGYVLALMPQLAQESFNHMILSTDIVAGQDKEIAQWADKYGELYYKLFHRKDTKNEQG